jgi:hypothetical protein
MVLEPSPWSPTTLQILLQMHFLKQIIFLSGIREQGLDHTSLSSGVHHLVLERCYFSSDNNASAKAQPSSHFGLSQQNKFSNQRRKANIMEVVCLAEGGSPRLGCPFLHVGAAVSWMRKHVSKTRRAFSKL